MSVPRCTLPSLPTPISLPPRADVALPNLARIAEPGEQEQALRQVASFLQAFRQMTARRPMGGDERAATAALQAQVKALSDTVARREPEQQPGLDVLAGDLDAWRRRHLVCRRPWAFDGLKGGVEAALQLTRAAFYMASQGDLVSEQAELETAARETPFVLGIDGFAPWLGVAVGLSIFDQIGGSQRGVLQAPVVTLDASFRLQAIGSPEDQPLQLAVLGLNKLDGRARRRLWQALYAHLMGRTSQAEAAGTTNQERSQHLQLAREVQAVAWRRNTRVLKEVLPAVFHEIRAELADYAPAGQGGAQGG